MLRCTLRKRALHTITPSIAQEDVHPPALTRPVPQVLSWFTEGEEAGRAGLRVCRVKNKFGVTREELVGGYRDLMFCVIYEGPRLVGGPGGGLVRGQGKPMIGALRCWEKERRDDDDDIHTL